MSMSMSPGAPAVVLVPPVMWGNSDGGGHSVQFYGDDVFLLDELSRVIGAALGAGDAGIVVATQAHRSGLARRLEARPGPVPCRRSGALRRRGREATLSRFHGDGQAGPVPPKRRGRLPKSRPAVAAA